MATTENERLTTLSMEQKKSPYLTGIQKEKRKIYPQFGEKILEFSIFDVSVQKTSKGDVYCIGIRILGSEKKFEMVDIQDLNLGFGQVSTIQNSFILKGIGVKSSNLK